MASDDLISKTCAKPDCQFEATGSCSEGHTPIASCPHLTDPDVVESEDDILGDDDVDAGNVVERIPLASGAPLSVEDVERLLLAREAVFIAVVGDSHSGKTTLLCSIYERFLRGPFAHLTFAGSRTLLAFEQSYGRKLVTA